MRLFSCCVRSLLRKPLPQQHTGATRLVSSIVAKVKLREATKQGTNKEFLGDELDKRLTRRRLPGMEGRPSEAAAIIKESATTADYEHGWNVFEAIQSPTAFECTAALSLCAKAAWQRRAWETWAKIPIASRDVVAYTSMIDVCARCKSAEKAELLFKEMESTNEVTPNIITYSSMVNVYSMTGHPEKALAWFERIPPDLLSAASQGTGQKVYNSIMAAYARIGDYAKTRELFLQMSERGLTPNLAHFNTLLTSCIRHRLTDIAQGVFDLTYKYGLTPSVGTWTALLSCNRHDLSRSLEIMKEMHQCGVAPSGLTYVELLEAHVLAKDFEGARALLANLDKFSHWQAGSKFDRLRQQVEFGYV